MVEWKWTKAMTKGYPDDYEEFEAVRRDEAEKKLAEKDKDNSALLNMLTDHVAINLCEYEGDVWVDQSPEGKEHWKKCARAHIEKLLKDL